MRRPLLSTSVALVVAGFAVIAATGAPAQAAPTADSAIGTYYPIKTNQRILDTRTTNGDHKAPLGPNGELALQVGGRAGVPAGNTASAVVLNLTGVLPTSSTFLTAYPSGTTKPGVSSLNLPPKAVRSNLVTVPVGTDGKVKLNNKSGSVNVVVDVMGYYARTDIQGTPAGIGSMYFIDTAPERLYDSRTDPEGALLPGDEITLGVDYSPANANVRAIAVNITAITPTASGFLTAWDGTGPAIPQISSVNFVKGQVVPNMAIVPSTLVGGVPSIVVANGSPSAVTHVAVDIVGAYFANETSGLRFVPLTPTRIVDTRNGTGGFKGTIGANAIKAFTAPGSVAITETYALVGNATAIAPTAGTFVTIYAAGDTRPAVSNLNATIGEIAANAAVVNLGPGNVFNVFNKAGNINIAVDVAGRLDTYTVPALEGKSAARSAAQSNSVSGAVTVTRR